MTRDEMNLTVLKAVAMFGGQNVHRSFVHNYCYEYGMTEQQVSHRTYRFCVDHGWLTYIDHKPSGWKNHSFSFTDEGRKAIQSLAEKVNAKILEGGRQ
jgi:hypothetical protein